MASGWEMGLGGMGLAGAPAPSPAPAYMYGLPSTDTLRIDDLLDLSSNNINHNHHLPSEAHLPAPSAMNAAAAAAATDDLLYYVPSEEAAELEWLSQFVEDSFSDMPYPAPFIAPSTEPSPAAGGRHRVKNPWASPPFPAAPQPHSSSSSANSPTSSSSTSDFPAASPKPKPSGRRKAVRGEEEGGSGGARRCSHCQSEKTPQWRTGPMGPKTLCNACGVRYKSGRLVPEYRPAASPTFVLTQHSNSHRKVMELRRQKELLHLTHDVGAAAAAAGGGGGLIFSDYEVC